MKALMLELHQHTKAPVLLTVAERETVLHIDGELDHAHRQLVSAPNISAPIRESTAGTVLLAYSPALTEAHSEPGNHPETLAKELASIRGAGIARGSEGHAGSIAAVAAPVFWSSGRIAAALGVYGKHSHIARPEISTALRRIAMQARPLIQSSWNELTAAAEPAIPEQRQG